MASKIENRPANLEQLITSELDAAYSLAEHLHAERDDGSITASITDALSSSFVDSLEKIAKLCEKASSGYLNVLTGMAIKAAYGDTVDVRYHQVQIQHLTDRPAGFNFRGVSEHIIYHWMEKHEFHGAKSGWQTRTFERPKPYLWTMMKI